MKIKQVKIRNADGSASYEDMVDIDGICEIALRAYADGERSAALEFFISWLKELGKKPTGKEFIAWFELHGGKFVDIKSEPHEN